MIETTANPEAPARRDGEQPAADNRRDAEPQRTGRGWGAGKAGSDAKRVDLRDVNLFYGDFHAVADVDMTIEPNKVTALIGSSGCGKTTVLRSINRMHELTPGARATGTIEIDGEDVYAPGVDPVVVRRLVGMVFQSPNPFPTMSIYDERSRRARTQREAVEVGARRDRRALPSRRPTSGMRSRTGSTSRDRGSPAVSSSGSASPARSRSSPRCC